VRLLPLRLEFSLEISNASLCAHMDSTSPDWVGVPRCADGGDVDVFATRVFAHFGKSGLGMFLR
jgi:hypothetical protein